jgi:putative Mg2+ transporter-C (MgtC) family protein
MLDWTEIIFRLGAASVIGALIGLNRDLNDKPSGLRTLSLVSLGAATIVLVSVDAAGDQGSVSRVLQGVLTGLGFLGAGVIIHEGGLKVHGLTTAAAVWVTACLGCACGIGAWRIVIVASTLLAFVLACGGRIEKIVRWWIGDDDNASNASDANS